MAGFKIRKTLQNYNAAEVNHTTATIGAKDHKMFVWTQLDDQNYYWLMSQDEEKGNNVPLLITKWEMHQYLL